MRTLIVVQNWRQREQMQRGIDPKVVMFKAYGDALLGYRFDKIIAMKMHDPDWLDQLSPAERATYDDWANHLPTKLTVDGQIIWA